MIQSPTLKFKASIIAILSLIFLPFVGFAQSLSLSPSEISSDSEIISIVVGSPDQAYQVFFPNGNAVPNASATDFGDFFYLLTESAEGSSPKGVYHIVLYQPTADTGECDDGSLGYQYCINGASYLGIDLTILLSDNGLMSLVYYAEDGYRILSGEQLSSSVSWAGNTFYLLWVSSGLSVLYELRHWIVALVIIGAVVYFAYRAFRFFRH